MGQQEMVNLEVIWRGRRLNLEVNRSDTVHDLGDKLLKLTNVKADTLRILVPQAASNNSRLISPFSDENLTLSLLEASILEGKPIRMMGASINEVKEVSETSMKSDLRILGFDEEEKRLRQRSMNSLQTSLKLPQGTYIFCDFRTLHLPGIELNPPPSEALKRMHMLACDPGIIAIMNKHRWRVGVMTEMAPVGYVGISPKCLLGFNKNQGEEISLRLRTDDLKGFRKYESIKKTLLHELAHMVYSEHDADFFALDRQLNQEAATLDWTKSRSHTLSGHSVPDYYDQDLLDEITSSNSGQKLGGASDPSADARASSVAAAYSRLLNAHSEESFSLDRSHLSDAEVEPDPVDFQPKGVPERMTLEPDPDDAPMMKSYVTLPVESSVDDQEPDPDDSLEKDNLMVVEPDASVDDKEPDPDERKRVPERIIAEPDPADAPMMDNYVTLPVESSVDKEEPDPDDSLEKDNRMVVEPDASRFNMSGTDHRYVVGSVPNDSLSDEMITGRRFAEPDPDDGSEDFQSPNNSQNNGIVKGEPDPDASLDGFQRIEEPAAVLCSRIQIAIKMLRSEATLVETSSALQTLVKIIRNIIEHPEELKFRRLRKSNPWIQKNVVNYKAAMEVLTTVGFAEDIITDEVGRVETYLVLKRNDPGLLWLAKSTLEVSIA